MFKVVNFNYNQLLLKIMTGLQLVKYMEEFGYLFNLLQLSGIILDKLEY